MKCKIVIATLMALFMTGCAGDFVTQGDEVVNQVHRFEQHKVDMDHSIWVDTETGVCYLWIDAGYGKSMTVLLNPDGTPILWESISGENE